MVDQHIKMPDIVPIVRYTANGVRREFEFPFPVFASEDVVVYVDGAKRVSGFVIEGAGQSEGGLVRFDAAPAAGLIVALERRIPLERMTDFLEGGELSARALNNEFDYIVAGLQQVARDQMGMLRYDLLEEAGDITLPAKSVRAGRALAFDAEGHFTTVAHGDTLAMPNYVQAGAGAVVRGVDAAMQDRVSVKDFGAVGDGVVDDTNAFIAALAAHDSVYVPRGVYRVTSTIQLKSYQHLIGAGAQLVADDNSFAVLHVGGGYCVVSGLRIQGGGVGVLLCGVGVPCVQNMLRDLLIVGADIGLKFDGGADVNAPCYWNNAQNVLVSAMGVHGIYMTKDSTGDSPNANRFMQCRVYSHGADMTGMGIYVEHGSHANSFVDCEVNLHGTALACVRLGSGANKTFLMNVYTESYNSVPNIQLDAGSVDTSIVNLHAMSDGAAIYDFSGGAYVAYNAGYPNQNTLGKTHVSDLMTALVRQDTQYVDAAGAATIDVNVGVSSHFVAATNGAITMRLPAASDVPGAIYTIKKIDHTGNIVTVTAASGTGPDGRDFMLGGRYDFVCVHSNGAGWFIVSSNRMGGNTTYNEGTGTYDINMATDTYLISSFSGARSVRLPPADAINAVGRSVTIKKTDPSANAVTVVAQGGGMIDGGSSVVLNGQYKSVTVVSNGAQWYILQRYL